jgi:SAM-dependent methyltransferase
VSRGEENRTEENRTEENRTEENRTEENRTEENRTEENRTEENRTEENRTEPASAGFDAGAHRSASLTNWEESAPGWVRRGDAIRTFSAPVSHWMLDALSLQPGERVLELAAGVGETGLLAAELVAPLGEVVISDQAEAMLTGARARAEELGLVNVSFQVLNAEWIDLPLASVDAVLCRWGYMLLADPSAALTETRRVLRPQGRLALAVWDSIQHNPWARLPGLELIERGISTPPAPGTPGPFALGDRGRVQELLERAGFLEIDVRALGLEQRHASFEAFWETTLDLSRSFHDAVLSRPESEIAEVRAGLASRLEPYAASDGTLALPARTLVARATA